MKEKIITILQKIKEVVLPKLIAFDQKVNTFLPNPKLKKVAYIGVGSLFGFMFLIIILGLLLSPLRNSGSTDQTVLKKPAIINESQKPQAELTENQKLILKLETEMNEMKFPESILNIPVIETDLSI